MNELTEFISIFIHVHTSIYIDIENLMHMNRGRVRYLSP